MKFSLCIPAYNRLDYLIEIIECCKLQTYSSFEVCISQDVAPGGLNEKISRYCLALTNDDRRFKYISANHNLGLAGNWNRLTEIVIGDYIFIPGDDDLIDPNFLQEFARVITKHNYDVVFCNQNFIDGEGNFLHDFTIDQNKKYRRSELIEGEVKEPIKLVLQNTIPMSAAIIKRDWLKKIKFDNQLNTPELEVFLKIALAGGRFYYINKQLADYRVHKNSATGSGLTIHRFVYNILNIDVPELYDEYKTVLLQRAMVPAINIALKHGNKTMAKELFNNKKYYPANRKKALISHYFLLQLPIFFSKNILKYLN